MNSCDEVGEFDIAAAYGPFLAVFQSAEPLTTADFEAAWRSEEIIEEAVEPGAADDTHDPGHDWQYAAGHEEPKAKPPSPDDEVYRLKRDKYIRSRMGHIEAKADLLVADQYLAEELARRSSRERANELETARFLECLPAPDIGTLSEVLARPAPPCDRIAGLLPAEGTVTLIAQNKVGKTTMIGNLADSSVTGSPFLGRFAVRPIAPDARVAILNYEVSASRLAKWLADIGVPEDRVVLVNLRGAFNPLSNDEAAQALADLLREYNVEFLIVDPFGRAIGGADQNSAREVQPWLNRLDRFAREMVGAQELVLVVHAGWNGERSRGSSALEDWPDAKWYLTKDDAGLRYFRAEGRDVDVDEDQLAFDPDTRHLTLTGHGDRSTAGKTHTLMILRTQVLDYLAGNPGASGNAVEEAISGNAADVRSAIKELVATGQVAKLKRVGKGGGYAYSLGSTATGSGVA